MSKSQSSELELTQSNSRIKTLWKTEQLTVELSFSSQALEQCGQPGIPSPEGCLQLSVSSGASPTVSQSEGRPEQRWCSKQPPVSYWLKKKPSIIKTLSSIPSTYWSIAFLSSFGSNGTIYVFLKNCPFYLHLHICKYALIICYFPLYCFIVS